ncbi:(2Fe-2S)-binding protein [Peribacillus sp. ACCC06369]|uniref:(2Fe-2S)-binding protein n=1 Tax=Peribacillus sp. ACCC06369 TaxID=3055860 RepID=UPI0025A173B8|nr:(2Fe-2S)-binding protein [Peribacillus sp. ACCC06369]MDM5357544.1 (2Fe-2S)-binding protein [Peribacillus sp. ACCC06369]
MHNLSPSIEKELQGYRISFRDEAKVSKTFNHVEDLIQYAQARSGAETARIAISMWFRRYAFFITAQFYMFSKHRLIWEGTLQDIGVLDDPEDEHWLPDFLLKNNRWSSVTEMESSSALHSILSSFGADAIRSFSGTTKISKLVLWENIWGYTVWMYSELLRQTDIKMRVEKDIERLLDDEVWLNIESRSPFKRFIGKKSVQESMNPYKRVTCCLYYRIEGHEKCAYCPNKNC